MDTRISIDIISQNVVHMLIFTIACTFKPSISDTASDTTPTDADADGYLSTEDCNDNDPVVHPGQPFTCVWAELPSCTVGQNEVFTEDFMLPPQWNSDRYVVPQE